MRQKCDFPTEWAIPDPIEEVDTTESEGPQDPPTPKAAKPEPEEVRSVGAGSGW